MTTDLARALSSFFVLVLVFVFACRTPIESTANSDRNSVPPELQEEYTLFLTNCKKCHSVSRALNAPVTDPKHWDLYVARMMRTPGSGISPQEAPRIVKFLHWYTLNKKKTEETSGEETAPAETSTAPAETSAAAPSPEPSAPASEPAASAPVPLPPEGAPGAEKTGEPEDTQHSPGEGQQ